MDHRRDDCRSKDFDESLLDAGESDQEVIHSRREENERESTDVERPKEHLGLSVGEDVRRWRGSRSNWRRKGKVRDASVERSRGQRRRDSLINSAILSFSPSMIALMRGLHLSPELGGPLKNLESLKESPTRPRHALIVPGILVISTRT